MVFWNVRLELLKYLLHQGQDPEGVPGAPALLGRELEMGWAVELSQGWEPNCHTNWPWKSLQEPKG